MLDNTNKQREVVTRNSVLSLGDLNERRAYSHNQRLVKFMTEVIIFAVKWYRHVSTQALFNLVN